MAKIKVKKNKHLRTLEDDIKNDVVVKNKILKKKEKEKINKIKRKRKKKDDFNKILNLANKENEEHLDHGINNLDEVIDQETDKFLEFDDDIQENSDISLNESNSKLYSHKEYEFNEIDESNDIFQEHIKINEEHFHKIDNKEDMEGDSINPLVKKCYKTIGEDLAHYKRGKLHRAFKILVKSSRWFEYILLTKPKKWTVQATFEATKLFSSGLKEVDVTKFYEFILLPIILENIEQNKKLDSFLYKTLIKALYKSNSWFKGILFPILQKECTKKQMIIIGSVVEKMSISVNSVMQGINEIFKFLWNPTIGYFLNIFFNKKYSFTKQFIENCVDYFIKFQNYPNSLTIIWHKSLLTLVHNYKDLFDERQFDRIRFLIQKKNHHQISNEILKQMYSQSSLINKIKDITTTNE